MTASFYDEPLEAAVPVFVWPVVLGVSLAAHLALVFYGLSDLHHAQTPPPEGPQTEIILESETLVFQKARLVGAGTAAHVPPAKVSPLAVATSAPAPVAVAKADGVAPLTADKPPAQTQISSQQEAIRPASVATAVVPPKTAVQTIRPSQNIAGQVTPERPTLRPSPPALPAPPERPGEIESVQEVVEKVQVQKLPKAQKVTSTSKVAPNKPARVDRAKAVPVTKQAGRTSVEPVAKTAAVQQILVSGVTRLSAAPKGPDKLSGNALTPVNTAQRITSSTGVTAVPVQPAAESASTDGPGRAERLNAGPGAVTVAPEQASRPAPVEVTPVANGSVVTPVVPIEGQLAALHPAEHGGTVISPSAPELVAVPDSEVTPDQAARVAPDHLDGIDPLAKVTGYVAGHDTGECTHMSVLSAGAKSAQVVAFGTSIDPFLAFDRKFAGEQGYEADIELRLITQNQCALLAAMEAAGVEAPGLLDLDRTEVASGTRLGGVIQRDLPLARIAQAQAQGADLSGRGAPELYLIDDAGQIHDGRSFVRPETSTGPIGGWRFSLPVTLVSERAEETALVLAIWNRPSGKQPGEFGTLPAARIADVLAEPGVYTLTAFKVLR